MPSQYEKGVEGMGLSRPSHPVFNDYEPTLDQLLKMWLIREQLRRKGYRTKLPFGEPPYYDRLSPGGQPKTLAALLALG